MSKKSKKKERKAAKRAANKNAILKKDKQDKFPSVCKSAVNANTAVKKETATDPLETSLKLI